ncbi:hypothetical protein ABN36_18165 [Salmonella enterica subsp. enterica]|nr:hypothetical protein [Salmonella enterica subsp. enterica]ECM8230933.1 hypothetical protein [Salmonella enterica subsp. enterica serovar Kentucky]EGI6509404.1 hypothetical protein [Salmonella enterica subsp. enterica serovar Durham]EHW9667319.1 hypothetical protein [Salmonella enterica subsp. enterica serovar Agbeni]EIU1267249.1 hypothetical protein [Salmonella enterica subsp. enterica serovar Agbeni]
MSADELALKFSSAPPEQLIGRVPLHDVREAFAEEAADAAYDELWIDHKFELEATEEITDAYATAIKKALTLPYDEAQKVLQAVINDNPGYGRDPQ